MCVLYGVGFAIVYSAWALLITLAGQGRETLESAGLSLRQVIGIYFAGGVTGGIIVGLAGPLTRSRIGAGLVGYVAALPAFAMIAKGLADVREPAAFWFVVLLGSLVGFVAGMWIWADERARREGS
jgi:hypothetical protein